ncbi:12389_t:CDS:2 [Racocetra persica]|uniref:12389_t:CDS:1 n=1 Tax=Racocetra persica TaxID=160502 RepID=A0ACA9M4F8_9GLOM|nr:12389_t:CDS:2 [Racocetra persica]
MSAEFLKSLSNDFVKLLSNVEDYNVIIKVGESPNILHFKAHSCVLRARSTYFHSALSSDWVKTDGNFIVFEKSNISPEVFQMILKYLYSGTICLENQNPTRLIDLLAAADELILTELVNYLKEYLLTYHDQWIRGFLGNWTKSLDSFTFSLGVESENLKNSKLSRIKQSNSRMAIFSADVRGPCFGNRDLWMPNYNNLSKKCSSRNSYYEKNIIDSQEFDIEDYEVFQVSQKHLVKERKI